jgi:hypothetical protein
VVLRIGKSRDKPPGQWPSMAEPAVMILHGFRPASLVVTSTSCCPSAAPTTPTLNLPGTTL